MSNFRRKIEAIFSAATFAEANEHDTALGFLKSSEMAKESNERAWGHSQSNIDSNKKATVRKALEGHFMAAAFAEAGAFEMAREMIPDYARKRTVLLAIEGDQANPATFEYALNLCKRIKAELYILQIVAQDHGYEVAPSESITELIPILERNGVNFKITCRRLGADDVLYDYLKDHRDVNVAVVDSPNLAHSSSANLKWRETFKKISQRLSVPLVTAMQREPLEHPVKVR